MKDSNRSDWIYIIKSVGFRVFTRVKHESKFQLIIKQANKETNSGKQEYVLLTIARTQCFNVVF